MAYKRQASKGIPALDRSVPKNDKFSHIQSSLNTGCNVNNVKTVTARQYAQRRDEIFYRITKKQLVELFQAYENDDFENIASSSGSPGNGPRIVSYSASQQQDTSDRPYLILDARDPISYNTCHIAQSLNFPLAMMKRDQIIPELFSHRNREEHLIIVYCDDERISAEASKFLVDRGTNNIFLLSNGMVDFVWDYQEYVEGNIPYPPPKQQKTPTKNTRRLHGINENELMDSPTRNSDSRLPPSGYNRSPRGGNGSGLTVNSLRRHDMMTGGTCRSNNSNACNNSEAGRVTNASTRSVAESIISRASARKGKF